MKPTWQVLQQHALDLAAVFWQRPFSPDRIDGVNFDGVSRISDEEIILLEITEEASLQKIRTDVAKIGAVKLRFSSISIVARSFIILKNAPTQGMRDAGAAHKVRVVSLVEFEKEVFDYGSYALARRDKSFGSAFDPGSGKPDLLDYIPVTYIAAHSDKTATLEGLVQKLFDRNRVVVLGEYGTGKSRLVREAFQLLSADTTAARGYTLAINLRDHWGAQSGIEILSGHLQRLGLARLLDRTMQLLSKGSIILLLDGFDELGAQIFGASENEENRITVRNQALAGVRDLIKTSNGPVLLTGRPHYFNDNSDLLSSVGLNLRDHGVEVYACRDEFLEEQANQYLARLGLTTKCPKWLPRKPLMFQVVSLLEPTAAEEILSSGYGEIGFWGQFIDTICLRESKLKKGTIDPTVVRTVLTNLARQARLGDSPLGKFSPKDINRAYEEATGESPDEAGNVMLSRLCTLGRVGPESADRQFVDSYILQLLFADCTIDDVTVRRYGSLEQQYKQAQLSNGLFFLAQWIDTYDLKDDALHFLHKESDAANAQLSAELVSALLVLDAADIDFRGKLIDGAEFAHLLLSDKKISNLSLLNCLVGDLYLGNHRIDAASNVKLENCLVAAAHGISSLRAAPQWMVACTIESSEPVSTANRIKNSNIPGPQKLLLSIVHKVFFQRGSGRKENTLFRGGYGQQFDRKTLDKIIKILMTEGVIRVSRDTSGDIYIPNREFTGRMRAMRDQLTLSKDTIWSAVGRIQQ